MKKLTEYKDIIILDFETTGLNFDTDRVIELGLIHYKRDQNGKMKLQEESDTLINTNIKLSDYIINLTGITNEKLEKEGINEYDLFLKFKNLLSFKPLVIAYNLQFDVSFLVKLMERYDNEYIFDCDVLDILAVYKDRQKYPHRLESAVLYYQLVNENAHNAISDAKATLAVLSAMKKEKNDIDYYINVIGYHHKYGINGTILPYATYIKQYGGGEEIIDAMKKD